MGYYLKTSGKLKLEDKNVLGTILMYITLPCAFVANFRNFQASSSLILFFLIGLVTNILCIGLAKILAGKKSAQTRAEYMIQGSGYNIGAFTTPFVGSIMDPFGTVVNSIFDIGNSIFSIGLIYPLAKREVDGKGGSVIEQLKFMASKLFGSVPFDTYLVMLVISLFGIKLPEQVSDVAAMLGAPSILITMIMIGIVLDIKINKNDLKDVINVLLIRYGLGLIFGFLIFQVPMFSLLEKKALLYCIFAPATSISPTYAYLCGCKDEVYGAVSSISIAISLTIFILISIIL